MSEREIVLLLKDLFRLQHGASVIRQDLDCIGDDLKTISAVEFAIDNADEVLRGKE